MNVYYSDHKNVNSVQAFSGLVLYNFAEVLTCFDELWKFFPK